MMRKAFSVLVSVVVLASLTTPILAQSNNSSSQSEDLNNRTQVRARLKELIDRKDLTLNKAEREARIAEIKKLNARARCELRKRNLDARLEFYDLRREQQSINLRRLIQNLQTAIDRIKKLNKDTTDLEKELDKLNDYNDRLRNAYFELEEVFNRISPQICEINKADNTELKNLIAKIDAIRKLSTETRKYVVETFTKTLKAELKPVKSSSSKSSSSTSTPTT
jgi:chromosome segregation ATPase